VDLSTSQDGLCSMDLVYLLNWLII